MTLKRYCKTGLHMAGLFLAWGLCASVHAQPAPAASVAAPVAAPEAPKPPPTQAAPFDWRETYAYTLGMQAYLYLFPWAYMPEPRWTLTESTERQGNRFQHVRRLENATKTNGGAPNNDALYSRAWIYVKDEPIILSVPEIRNRYYTMEIVDFMGDNFDYVGLRTTGPKAGHYAIAYKGWKGKLPAGVKLLKPSSTPWAFIMGRTAVQDEADLKAVITIQDQYKLTPLSQWGKANPPANTTPEIWKPLDRKNDPLADWKTISRTLTEVPSDPRDADMMQQYARIGIAPGADIEALDASTKRGLARAAADGFRTIMQGFVTGYMQKKVNGWNFPPSVTGRPTPTRDWLFRAIQMQIGFVANDPEEAMYLNVATDGAGRPLAGDGRYEVRFPAGGLPQVKAFWSVTMYTPQSNLVPNAIERYALGDRSAMQRNADGSLTMYLQKESPGADKESNWLPAPAGRFFLILRAYLPGEDLLKQTWQPPLISRVESDAAK